MRGRGPQRLWKLLWPFVLSYPLDTPVRMQGGMSLVQQES